MGLFNSDDNPTIKKVRRFMNNVGNVLTNGEPIGIGSLGMDTGSFGEYASEYVLNNMALTDLSKIRTVKNAYLDINGFSTEVDVIAVTQKGIYVLESKNYSGWIFGDKDSKYWMQSFKSGEKHQFYNPIKQNETHVKKLADYLNISAFSFYSYIVFSDRCELKKIPGDTDQVHVIRRCTLLWRMKDELTNRRTIYSEQDVDDIFFRLLPLTTATKAEKQEHVQKVKNLQSGTTCPFCGKALTLRNGKYGDFYGCTGYPNCKFTRKK